MTNETDFELTPREREVYLLVVEDAMSYKDIASRLGIGLETVKRHLANVKDKTGMTTCLELAVRHYRRNQGAFIGWTDGAMTTS
jgi:two-component system, NarL family, nitrate/nitrite response regulator NarL